MDAKDPLALRDAFRTDLQHAKARLVTVEEILNLQRRLVSLYEELVDLVESFAEASGAVRAVVPPVIAEGSSLSTRVAVDRVFLSWNKWMTVKEVEERAREAGWEPPAGTPDPLSVIRTAVTRYWKTGEAERHMRDGRTAEYRHKRFRDTEPPAATGGSDSSTSTDQEGGDSRETYEAPSSAAEGQRDPQLGASIAEAAS